MKRFASIALVATVLLAGCDNLKEALTAHVETVAQAGSQELSVNRLAQMLASTPNDVQIANETARAIADVWVNYQLLAHSAARNDSLNDPKEIDEAMWFAIAQAKTSKLIDTVSKGWVGDTNVTDAIYAQGQSLSAQHILLTTPAAGTPAQIDSVRRRAEGILAQARANPTAANFAALATRHTMDPGSKERGGLYPVFPRAPAQGAMVEEFEKGIAALKPGEIGPLVRTSYGFHITRRPMLSEVRADYARAHSSLGAAAAESTYLAKLEADAKVEVKPKGPATVRAVAQDLDAHQDDRTVVASSTAGNLQASRVARFIGAIPPREQMQLRQQIEIG